MSKQREAFTPPDFSGQSKIMFFNEGNPAAILLVNRAGTRSTSSIPFSGADAALAWCRQNGAILVHMPVALERN